jgi:hypothetical protein
VRLSPDEASVNKLHFLQDGRVHDGDGASGAKHCAKWMR